MLCDNEAPYKNNITTESVLKKKHHYIDYHRYMGEADFNIIMVAKQGTEKNIADQLSKIMTASRRRFLL